MYVYIYCISVLIYDDIRIQAAFGYLGQNRFLLSQWKIDQPFRFDHGARALLHRNGYPLKWYVSVGGFKPLEQDGASGVFITITISRLCYSPPFIMFINNNC